MVHVEPPTDFDYLGASYSVEKLVFLNPFSTSDDLLTKRTIPVGDQLASSREHNNGGDAPPPKKKRRQFD